MKQNIVMFKLFIVLILSIETLQSVTDGIRDNSNSERDEIKLEKISNESHNIFNINYIIYRNNLVLNLTDTKNVANVQNMEKSSFEALRMPNYQDDDTESCVCVPYYQCNSNNTLNTDGTDLIDIREARPRCDNLIDVCCDSLLNRTQQVEPQLKEPSPTGRLGCGKRNEVGFNVRILNGPNNEAEYGEFPWMIALLKTVPVDINNKLHIYVCGGSLIHPQVVLTAAHCVIKQNKLELLARAGEWNTDKEDNQPHQDRKVIRVIIHENYYSGGLFNDIALVILEEPVTLTDYIDTVCLPDHGKTYDNTCTASGWGKDSFGDKGKHQTILKKIDLPIVARDQCQRTLRKTRLGEHFKLHKSFVCAGGQPGYDTCTGDGGSPLVCPIQKTSSNFNPRGDHTSNFNPRDHTTENRYVQTGIVAWGIGCGTHVPGVYVNVPMFRHWIDNWMNNLKFNTMYYTL